MIVAVSGILDLLATAEGNPETNQRSHGNHDQRDRLEMMYVRHEVPQAAVGYKRLVTPFCEQTQRQRHESAYDRDQSRAGLEDAGP